MLGIRPQYKKVLRYNIYATMGVHEDWTLVKSNVPKDQVEKWYSHYKTTWRILKLHLIN